MCIGHLSFITDEKISVFSVELDGLAMDMYVDWIEILMASLMKNYNVQRETVLK